MKKYFGAAAGIVFNLLMALVVYWVCRVAFLLDNWDLYSLDMSWRSFGRICWGGLLFDTSAICYTNILYIALALFPFHDRRWVNRLTHLAYVIPNAVCVVLNLGDAVYYPYGHHRITTRVFNEFGNENNLLSIFGVEVVRHWYFILLAVALVWVMWRCYVPSVLTRGTCRGWKQAIVTVIFLGLFGVLAVWGMRGSTFFTSTRPIAVSNAHQFAKRPSEANIVLNTPFSLIRTLGKRPPRTPRYYATAQELDSVYTPLHHPADSAVVRRKNVVILIVESFATEFIGSLNGNRTLDGGKYRGYAPFVDSLASVSLTFETTLANANVSIDAMPAVLASIPRMDYGFFVSPYSLNHVTSFATELKNWGYSSAFFHGGDNESMGFQAFARGAGFEDYYGMTEYCADSRFGGKKDFDGTWAIWDEEFLQYFALKLSEMPVPFVGGVFTASSHHPFAIPERYKDVYKDEGIHLLHKCIRYTDNSLRRFFATASEQPWYDNTVFVLTADHSSSKTTHDEYKTDAGDNHVPILLFDPSGEMPRGVMPGIMQQMDVLPTVLGWLGYDRDFIAFGNDMLATSPEERWAFNWAHLPQLYMGDYFIQTDENCNVRALYDYRRDILMKHDLKDERPAERDSMQRFMKAFMQSYFERMEADSIRVKPSRPQEPGQPSR